MVWYRRLSFQRHSNLPALFSTQRSELKSVLGSQRTNNLRRDHMSFGGRKGDFERNGLAKCQDLSNESVQATFAEITCPALHGRVLAVSLDANPNLCLKHMAG